MKSFSVGRIPRGLILISIFLGTCGLSYSENAAIDAGSNPCSFPVQQSRAFPRIDLGCGRSLNYLGVYTATGDYKTASRSSGEGSLGSESMGKQGLRPSEVPTFINLHPRGYAVENFAPPSRATNEARGQSVFASLRDDIVTLVYGREKIIATPNHLTTDSRGRLIIADPAAAVVHVLDGSRSFRIAGGQGRRLRSPNGVAVDSADNIYVSDSERGLVEVYDPNGRYLRNLGTITSDEAVFQFPTGIAIDRVNDRLYVLDPPRNLLVMLDLEGRVLKRVGFTKTNASGLMLRERSEPAQAGLPQLSSRGFDHPTEITVQGGEVVILDAGNRRIQILDLDCNFLRQFITPPEPAAETGIAVDIEGNILISNNLSGGVRIYNRVGNPVGSFGRSGNRVGEFRSPRALWIDSTNTVYVSDTGNHRVQVFRIDAPQHH